MLRKETPVAQPVETLLAVLRAQPVIPVVVIDDAADAVPLAKALVAGGLPAIEITLRTPAGLSAIKQIADHVPDAIVGAGTILNGAQYDAAVAAGSKFVVSPGFTTSLANHVGDSAVPLLPGATSAGEIMTAMDHGYRVLKFFPAEQSGGTAFLKSLSSVFGDVKFCPTGGISAATAPEYLSLSNVVCIGGSWVTPKNAIAAGDWDAITKLAKEAATLK